MTSRTAAAVIPMSDPVTAGTVTPYSQEDTDLKGMLRESHGKVPRLTR
jgi:hypothetical protein